MDVFIEQLVKRKNTGMQLVKRVLLWVSIPVAGYILLILGGIFNLQNTFSIVILVFAGYIFLMWRVSTSMNVEFEYAVTNGYLDVDKVIAQRKRKRLLSAQCKDVDEMGRYAGNAEKLAHRSFDHRIVADNPDEESAYYLSLHHRDLGHVLVVFNPDERVLEAMRKFLPRQVQRDVFPRG